MASFKKLHVGDVAVSMDLTYMCCRGSFLYVFRYDYSDLVACCTFCIVSFLTSVTHCFIACLYWSILDMYFCIFTVEVNNEVVFFVDVNFLLCQLQSFRGGHFVAVSSTKTEIS